MATKVETTTASDQCYGYQVFPALTTALFLSAPTVSGQAAFNPRFAELACELAAARYRSDGVLCTISSGMPMISGQRIRLGVSDWSKVSLIGAGAQVTVEYWGEPKPAGS